MESAQIIKRRLKSINNIGQITKAMELVAATKMRKSQEIALNSRPYAYTALDLLARISSQEKNLPALLEKRPIEKTAFVIVTSDKGLAGSFNGSVIRIFKKYIKEKNIDIKEEKYSFIGVGKKAINYLQNEGIKTAEKFIRVGDFTDPSQTNSISDFISEGYLKKHWDEVLVFSTYFRSALKQEVLIRKIFPVELSDMKKSIEEVVPQTGRFSDIAKQNKISGKVDEYLIEPSPKSALEELVIHLNRMRFYHLILETNASEHAARRVAMKNASDNAKELFENLNIEYNKSRQSNITKEITEIVSSMELLNN